MQHLLTHFFCVFAHCLKGDTLGQNGLLFCLLLCRYIFLTFFPIPTKVTRFDIPRVFFCFFCPFLFLLTFFFPVPAAMQHLCWRIQPKVGVLTGTEGDATPFTDVTVANVSSTLHKIGFQKHGNEVMYSGHTGRMLNTKVCVWLAGWLAGWLTGRRGGGVARVRDPSRVLR